MGANVETIRIAIVDDEKFWRDKTESIIVGSSENYLLKIKQFESGEEFLGKKEYFDIVFLDVKMKGMDGFEIAKQYRDLHRASKVVFLTAHEELCRKGYHVNAFRYIIKDNMEEEIVEAMTAVKKDKQSANYIVLQVVGEGMIPIVVSDIVGIQMDNRRLYIHTKYGEYVSNMTVKSLETLLARRGFFRSHRSCIVNLAEVAGYTDYAVIMKDSTLMYLSQEKVKDLKQALENYQFDHTNS